MASRVIYRGSPAQLYLSKGNPHHVGLGSFLENLLPVENDLEFVLNGFLFVLEDDSESFIANTSQCTVFRYMDTTLVVTYSKNLGNIIKAFGEEKSLSALEGLVKKLKKAEIP